MAKPVVTGLAETLAALRRLPEVATQKNVLRRALVKAAQPIADAARAIAPDDPRTSAPDLRSSIGVATELIERHRSKLKENDVEVYVGPTRQVGRSVLRYASNVEYGTFRAAPHPYLRPAFDANKAMVMDILAKELTVEFEAAVRRASKKSAKR
jgi:HK97 gp10 family phage protein